MSSNSLFPIVISIVGHRDPTEESAIKNQGLFKYDLYKLADSLPHSPIFMMNGLASGMDLIAAKVFLDFCHDRNDALQHRLIAVLPKPLEQYKSEIRKEDWSLFEMIMDSTLTSVLDPSNCMALRPDVELTSQTTNISNEDCYLRQSVFLVEHSSVLFAFTDGINNGKQGGTSYTVQLAKNQVYSSLIDTNFGLDDYAPIAIVEYHTGRLSGNNSINKAFSTRYWKQCDLKKDLSAMTTALIKVDGVNSLLSLQSLQLPAKSSVSVWKLIDGLATEYKKRYQQGLFLFLGLGFMTALTLVRPGWQIIGMTIILVSVYYLPWIQSKFRENFIAFRCLAESILIIHDWFSFGIFRNPAALFRTSLHHELEWVRAALRSYGVNMLIEGNYTKIHISWAQITAYLSKIEGQLQWLETSIRKQRKKELRLLNIIGLIYLLGCISSFMFLLAGEQASNKDWLEWMTESFMALLVITIGFRELMGFHEINARYARSIAQIDNSLDTMRNACDSLSNKLSPQLPMIRNTVRAIGTEKMDELNDWVSDQLKRSYSP